MRLCNRASMISVLVLGLVLAARAAELDANLLARLEPLSSRSPLDGASQDAIRQALSDKEADDQLLAALLQTPRLLVETQATTVGTPACFGTYSNGAQYDRPCCEVCGECIAMVQDFVGAIATKGQADALSVATESATHCANASSMIRASACSTAEANITNNIRVAQRAAQLCTVLGVCQSTCKVPANATSLFKGTTNANATALDLCTKEGIVGGTSILEVVNKTGTCATDASCTNSTCDMSSPKISTTCANGVDTSINLGVCKAFCDLDSTKTALNNLNSLVRKCDNSSNCAADEDCVPSIECSTTTCPTGANAYVRLTCSSVCAPAVRQATTATIAEDAKSIVVGLNSPALPASFPCNDLFDTATNSKLGANAWCSANQKTLTITLVAGSSIVANNKLFIKGGQTVLRDMLVQNVTFAAGNVSVVDCVACKTSPALAPVVSVAAPQFISLPSSAASALDVWIDASQSFDPAGRPLASVTWAVVTDASDAGALTHLVGTTNNKTSLQDKLRLQIPAAALVNGTTAAFLKAGSYAVSVTATNWVGQTKTVPVTFAVKAACSAPVLSIIGGTAQKFVISEGIKIDSLLDATSVCSGDEVIYKWTASDPTWSVITSDIANRKTLFIPGPVAGVTHGVTKTVTLTAVLRDHNATTVSIPIGLTAIGSPLIPALKAPSGDVKSTATVKLDATGSADPDDPNNLVSVPVFKFGCSIVGSLGPCSETAIGSQAGGILTVPMSQLVIGKEYELTVVVTKGGRTASAATTIKVVDGNQPIPTGKVIRQCGGFCPPQHSANEPLSLSLQLDAGYASAVIAWSGPPDAGVSGTTKDLTITSLPRTLGAQLTVSATMTLAGKTGTATITVPLNHAPFCTVAPAASCISATAVKDGTGAVKDTFPGAAFLVAATGIEKIGGSKLTYEFGLVTGGRQVPAGLTDLNSYTLSGLPLGSSTAYVCAIDEASARLCMTTAVEAKPPAANFNAAAALDTVDIAQAEGTGDVAALNKIAMSITSIASYATTTTSTTTATPESVAAAAAVQTAVNTKAASIISSLATTMDVRDPQAMQTAVSAVVSLGKASTNMTAETKGKVLDVASKGIAAIKSSNKPVTPDLASQLLSGLSLGSLKSPKAKTGRSLLATAAETAALSTLTSLLNPMADISDLLGAIATPSSIYVPAGDLGLFTSVTNQPGRALAPITLQAGSLADNKTSISKSTNAVLTFAGQFTGPCTTVELNGTETNSQCVDGNVRVAAQYYEDPTVFTDVKAAPLLAAAGLDAIASASGVVKVAMSGSAEADAALPCATAGACSIDITVPLLAAPTTGQTPVCLRVEGLPSPNVSFAGYPSGTGYSVAEVLPTTSVAPSGAATCRASRGGSYLMALATPTPKAAGVPEVVAPVAPANTTAFTFQITFQMDYATLVANAVKMDAFKLDARTAMSKAVGLPLANILITSLVQGSVVITMDIYTPDTWSPAQINGLATLITSNPGAIFDATFQSSYAITGVSARVVSVLPPVPASNAMALGLGIGLGVGGTLIIVAIVVIVLRRKKMGVEPRGRTDPEAPMSG